MTRELTVVSSKKLTQITDNNFVPNRLITARKSNGFNLSELAEKVGVSRQSVSKYESGMSQPTNQTVLKISDVTGFPLKYFYKNKNFEEPNATFFRSQASTAKKVRMKQVARISELGEIIGVIESKLNLPESNLIDSGFNDFSEITFDKIEEAAIMLRNKWGVSRGPINNLVNLVEANGVIVSSSDLPLSKLDAASSYINAHPIILLSDLGGSGVRRRLNVAHELGHLVMHGFVDDVFSLSNQEYKIMEKQANQFAGAFLLPADSFTDDVVSISMEYLIRLKQKWKVSIAAMVVRLKDLEYITDDQALYLNKKISWNHWRKKEPLDDSIEVEAPELFKKSLEMLEQSEIMSKSDVKAQLLLPLKFLERVFNTDFATTMKKDETTKLRLVPKN